jgi:Zn-dependent protease
MNAEITPERIQLVVQGMIILILSVAVHEFGHAWAANRIGDSLPRRQGRLTLNPMAHADPIGTIALPLLFLFTTGGLGFGWGKPVEHMTHDRKRRVFISLAGPMMNVFLAVTVAIVHVALLKAGAIAWYDKISGALEMAVFLNFILFFFNLLPAAPLDGGSVARGIIPHDWVRTYDQYAVYAPFVVLAFKMVPQIGIVLRWPAETIMTQLYHGLGFLLGVHTGI